MGFSAPKQPTNTSPDAQSNGKVGPWEEKIGRGSCEALTQCQALVQAPAGTCCISAKRRMDRSDAPGALPPPGYPLPVPLGHLSMPQFLLHPLICGNHVGAFCKLAALSGLDPKLLTHQQIPVDSSRLGLGP